jgi:DNA-binding response OmpR family regulator
VTNACHRAVVIEDNIILAAALKDLLSNLGYQVTACTGSYEGALIAARDADCDFAVVDLNLGGVMAFPVLDALALRGVGYVLTTSFRPRDIPARYRAAPTVAKPYGLKELLEAVEVACDAEFLQTEQH